MGMVLHIASHVSAFLLLQTVSVFIVYVLRSGCGWNQSLIDVHYVYSCACSYMRACVHAPALCEESFCNFSHLHTHVHAYKHGIGAHTKILYSAVYAHAPFTQRSTV